MSVATSATRTRTAAVHGLPPLLMRSQKLPNNCSMTRCQDYHRPYSTSHCWQAQWAAPVRPRCHCHSTWRRAPAAPACWIGDLPPPAPPHHRSATLTARPYHRYSHSIGLRSERSSQRCLRYCNPASTQRRVSRRTHSWLQSAIHQKYRTSTAFTGLHTCSTSRRAH